MFAPCINSIKALFIVPTDARDYRIVEILKQLKLFLDNGRIGKSPKTLDLIYSERSFAKSTAKNPIV
jgi:hypothetical protein